MLGVISMEGMIGTVGMLSLAALVVMAVMVMAMLTVSMLVAVMSLTVMDILRSVCVNRGWSGHRCTPFPGNLV